MLKLPIVKQSIRKSTAEQFSFKGMKHSEGARDGDIYDAENISFDDYPSVTVRKKRRRLPFEIEGEVYGIGSADKLFWCSGDSSSSIQVEDSNEGVRFYYDGEAKFPVSATEKTFSVMNKYICIFPDKMYFSLWGDEAVNLKVGDSSATPQNDTTEEGVTLYESLELLNEAMEESEDIKDGDVYAVGLTEPYSFFQYNSQGKWDTDATVENHAVQTKWIYLMDSWGKLSGCETVENNTSTTTDTFLTGTKDEGKYYFAVLTPMNKRLKWIRTDDILLVSLKTEDGTISKHYVTVTEKETVREYRDGKDYHFFYINAEVNGGGKKEVELTVERVIPDLTHTFCHDNRLWGIDGDKICASKIGDPFNFQDFSTIADAAWQVAVASSGPFTGGIAYNGYPTFFKEDRIIRVSGDYPSQYSTYETASVPGVLKGSGKSLAIADGVLYYLSPEGACRYTGSYPTVIGEETGRVLVKGVGGAGADKYFLEARDLNDEVWLYVYDSSIGYWTKEEKIGAVSFAHIGRDLYAMSEGGIYLLDSVKDEGEAEGDIESVLEFAPIYDGHLKKKGVSRIHLSLKAESGAEVKIFISYDGGDYKEVMKISPTIRRNFNIPLIVRRCGFYQLKIMAKGGFTLYGIGRERYFGSEY